MNTGKGYCKRLIRQAIRWTVFIAMVATLQSCYHYRILTTQSDPATEYQSKIVWSYCWGLINKPMNLTVPNCTATSGLDEIRVTQNIGSLLLTLVTLGIVAPVKVEWKCHKPCPRSGGI